MKKTLLTRKTALRQKKPVNKSRSKPRPGRVKGKTMDELRRASWQAARGLCRFCSTYVPFAEMELAHKRAKRMWGDGLDNVGPAHSLCHRNSHQPKACPPKT